MSEVRTKFIDVIMEAETVNYLRNESVDTSAILDDLTGILDTSLSLLGSFFLSQIILLFHSAQFEIVNCRPWTWKPVLSQSNRERLM